MNQNHPALVQSVSRQIPLARLDHPRHFMAALGARAIQDDIAVLLLARVPHRLHRRLALHVPHILENLLACFAEKPSAKVSVYESIRATHR
jgi:hypothetical protein